MYFPERVAAMIPRTRSNGGRDTSIGGTVRRKLALFAAVVEFVDMLRVVVKLKKSQP